VAFGVTVAAVIGVVAFRSSGSQTGSANINAPARAATRPRAALLVETNGGMRRIPARLRSRWALLPPQLARASVAAWAHTHLGLVDTSRMWARTSISRRAVAALVASVRSRVAAVRLRLDVNAMRLHLPAIHQVYRNDCEATALAMMLDKRVGQRRLQSLLPIARPLVPQTAADGAEIWGDPERGFVGDVRAGGYGVYEHSLLALARRFQPTAVNLTSSGLARVVDALRNGRPVIAWIAFGPSTPVTWHSPAGRLISANWAEHTILLVGWRPGRIAYLNPWTGRPGTYTTAAFASVWHILGRRAIAGQSLLPQ
jgi:uncharacterized protein YvpB